MIIIKTIFIAIAIVILSFVTFLVLRDVIEEERYINQKGKRKMKATNEALSKKQVCSKCKIGQESYEIDRHSAVCPYIACLRNGKCQFFKPIEKTQCDKS